MELSKEAKLFLSFGETTLCMICKHLHLDVPLYKMACDAFPKGIPWDIISSRDRHTEPYPGDNGIMFAEAPEEVEKDEAFESKHPRGRGGR
jgi:hypothetical protein